MANDDEELLRARLNLDEIRQDLRAVVSEFRKAGAEGGNALSSGVASGLRSAGGASGGGAGGGALGGVAGKALGGLGGGLGSFASSAIMDGVTAGGLAGAAVGFAAQGVRAVADGYRSGYESAPLFAGGQRASAEGRFGAEESLINFAQGALGPLGFLLSDAKRGLAEEKERKFRPIDATAGQLGALAEQNARDGIAFDEAGTRQLADFLLVRNRAAQEARESVNRIVNEQGLDPLANAKQGNR